jgi:glycosyltransferase involved in cell wall biosynthesis
LSRAPWDFSEIVVVDDGSQDGTAELARRSGARLIANPGNRGKGFTVRNGILQAQGEWVLFSDAGLSSPIEELEKLWRITEKESADVAIGSRALDRSLIGVYQPFFRDRVGRLFNLVMRLSTGLPFHDTQCGFKLFEARAAKEIFSRQHLNGFGFDVEALYIARRLGFKCLEVPVKWNDVAGTKVSMWRGVAAFLDPIQVRWNGLTGKYK